MANKRSTNKTETTKTASKDEVVQVENTQTKRVNNKKGGKNSNKQPEPEVVVAPATPAKVTKPTKSKAVPVKEDAAPVAVVPVKVEPEVVENEPLAECPTKTRYFKVLTAGTNPRGRFSGCKPKQAANKALTSIIKTRKEAGEPVEGQFNFSIQECTRNSRHKTYNYTGERIKLTKPMKVDIQKAGAKKTITYRFNNRVMKAKAVAAPAPVVAAPAN